MDVTTLRQDSCTVVQVVGQLDGVTSPHLEAVLQDLLDDQEQRQIVVDLSGVPDMSSAGLRVIISATKRLRSSRTGGDLRLAGPSKRVVDVLELAGLLPVVHVYGTWEEAVESFKYWGSSR